MPEDNKKGIPEERESCGHLGQLFAATRRDYVKTGNRLEQLELHGPEPLRPNCDCHKRNYRMSGVPKEGAL